MINWNRYDKIPPRRDKLLILVRWNNDNFIVTGKFDYCEDGFHEHFNFLGPLERRLFFQTLCGCPCVCSGGECLELEDIKGWILLESLIPTDIGP